MSCRILNVVELLMLLPAAMHRPSSNPCWPYAIYLSLLLANLQGTLWTEAHSVWK